MVKNENPDKSRLTVVVLLMAVMVISVLDKSIFAFAGVQIINELKLTPEQFGLVGSAFYFLYSVSGVLVGFIANRVPSRLVLIGMSLVWMLAQALTALSSGFAALMASRMLLGAGCGPGTAVTLHACFKWYAPRERILPSALIQVAIMIGAICGALSLPLIIEHAGWRTAYMALAGIGLLWLTLWLLWGREGSYGDNLLVESGTALGHGIPYRRLLLDRTFFFVTVASFCCYLPTALVYSWVPVYLQKGLGLAPIQSGYVVMVCTLGVISLSLGMSALSQRAMKRGASMRRAMVVTPLLATAIGGAALMVIGLSGNSLKVILILYIVGGVLVNLLPIYSNSLVAFITPDIQRGSMLATHTGLITTAGMIGPHLVGKAISWQGGDISRGFELTIALFGIAIVASALLGLRYIDPEKSLLQLAPYRPTPHNEAVEAAPSSVT